MKKRVTLGWVAFNKVNNMTTNIMTKRSVLNGYMPPVMRYGSEMCSLPTAHRETHEVAQGMVEQIIPSIILRDKKRKTRI